SSQPTAGTDAYNAFNGFVDFEGGTGASLEIAGSDHYTYAFSGLDTGDVVTYDFTGTAIRGNTGYDNRWTMVTLSGADAATAAHSTGSGVVVVSPTQVAIMAGSNAEAGQGFVAHWTDIDPGADGVFSVVSTHYTGAVPGGGTADGNKSYAISGIRLEEVAPAGLLSGLKRIGNTDDDDAGDFLRTLTTTKGQQNDELTVPFGGVIQNRTGLGFSSGQQEYDDLTQTDVELAMHNVNASVWSRIEFDVADTSIYDRLVLRMKYDDGFVAYLNGTEVARRNADNPLAYNTVASARHEDVDAVVYEDINISAFVGLLQDGPNVLAIHGQNLTAANTDFLIVPELIASGGSPATGLHFQPGLNRVVARAFDGPDGTGNQVDSEWLDIWYDPAGGVTTVPGGPLSGTMTALGGPYRVTGNVTVAAGTTLTIEPGTTIFFEPGTGMTVHGRLLAEGAENQQIRLTSYPGSGAWNGLEFDGTMEDNRLDYIIMEAGDGLGHSVDINNSQVTVDHTIWARTTHTLLEMHDSSVEVRNSILPTIDNDEAVHGSGIAAGGHMIFDGNTFGTTTGYSDVIDFTGGKRPGPTIQILNNVFIGGSDDGLDLDGTDAHIEGNVFMHFHQDAPRDSSSNAIATGKNGSDVAEITVVRNIFFDNDHDVLLKEGSSMVAEQNTFIGAVIASINFDETNRSVTPGAGAALRGNIFWGMTTTFQNQFSQGGEPDPVITVDNSILPAEHHGLGQGNLDVNPYIVDAMSDAHLRAISAAIGAGPNGLDMGAYVSAGASIGGTPPAVTHRTDATLTIDGPVITAYRYRVDGSPWSASIPVASPIELSGLANGSHQVDVIGMNYAGTWQDEADPTIAEWTVDTAHQRLLLNEVLAVNTSAVAHEGTQPDLIEIYNDSASPIDLSGMSISDDPLLPQKFVFPANTILAAESYLVLYADSETDTSGIHLGFSLDGDGEGVYLFDTPANGSAELDSIEFGIQLPNLSIGRVGKEGRWKLTRPSFGTANTAQPTGDPMTLKLNEWLADERILFTDDFIEVYNPDPLPVALEGLYLTDDLDDEPDKHQIAPLSFVAGSGYALFTPDGNIDAGADHVDFRLSPERELLGLFDPNLIEIDKLIYFPQTTDVSQGLVPDGGQTINFFPLPTPGVANSTTTTVTAAQIGFTDVWSYYQSGAPGAGWQATNYAAEATWPTGAGLLYVEGSDLPEPKSTALTIGQSAYYFRKHFTLDADPADVTELIVSTVIDDGA
ncbi:MAG TPA: lamin tail domain-containing protein, partial [Thermoguttaceae bacterium]|nr:lamin tail domain-containing protein [Thermoguttaceae bacterium]